MGSSFEQVASTAEAPAEGNSNNPYPEEREGRDEGEFAYENDPDAKPEIPDLAGGFVPVNNP